MDNDHEIHPQSRVENYLEDILEAIEDSGMENENERHPQSRTEVWLEKILEAVKEGGGGGGTLEPATPTKLGGVKIGDGINVTEDGTISASGLPTPTADGVALIGVNGEWKQQSGYGYEAELTIEWDGDTTGRETLPAEFGFGNNYKVSDNCPNIPDKIVVTVLYRDQEFVDEYAPIELEEGLPIWCVSGASGMMVIGVSEDFDVEGIAFHKGIYFLKYEESGISALTTKAVFPSTVQTIDPKFIPSDYPTMTEVESAIAEAIGGAVDDSY